MKTLCKLIDIEDGEARGFDIELNTKPFSIVCVRQGQQVKAYKNSCPHTGVNLEWLPDQFLDDTRQYLVCSTHGALFQIEDGHCVAGPCQGDYLTALPVSVDAGDIVCDTTDL